MLYPSSRKSCRCGKRCFPTEVQARAELIHCQRQGREERRYYLCHLSGQWHLTSQAKAA